MEEFVALSSPPNMVLTVHMTPLTGEYEPSLDRRTRGQVDLYEATRGKEGNTMLGRPIVIVTMKGASSGKLRKIPLMRVEHDGVYAIVASMGGSPKNPTWYNNVVANPLVELQDGAVVHDYQAREVTGDEKAIWWERAVETYPPYADYQKRTDRVIPVFVLEPVD